MSSTHLELIQNAHLRWMVHRAQDGDGLPVVYETSTPGLSSHDPTSSPTRYIGNFMYDVSDLIAVISLMIALYQFWLWMMPNSPNDIPFFFNTVHEFFSAAAINKCM
jgi:hypothetical protein